MHVKKLSVRTTIELTSRQRALLLKLAAERGEKGFSRLIQEAVDRYLEERASRRERIDAALGVLGTIDDATEARLRESVAETRRSWR